GADDAPAVDQSHRVTVADGEILAGLNFGNQPTLGEVSGTKFNDLDGDGVRDADEPPLEGVTIYLDANDNGVLDAGTTIEPDEFAVGTSLNNIVPEATLTAINSLGTPIFGGQVLALSDTDASTGSNVIGNVSPVWFANGRLLRIDFTEPVSSVSIDYISQFGFGSIGQLEIFDADENLLGQYSTVELADGEAETMTLTRPTPDIAFAIASPQTVFGLLDNLRFGNPERSTQTNANGEYRLTDLEPGELVIREVVPEGFEQTSPAATPDRLFATNVAATPDQIVEIDPSTGEVINQFPTPGNDTSATGLAFDGATLYYVNAINDTLDEVDPNTGDVLESTALPAGAYDGLATIDGLVYVLNFGTDDVLVFDPVSNTIVNTLDVNGTNPGLNLIGALGEIDGQLIGTTSGGDVVLIDPQTAQATVAFNHGVGSFDAAATGFGGEIYLGFNNPGLGIRVFDPDGTLLRTLSVGFPVFGLGGAAGSTDNAHRVTVAAAEIISGLDFGNRSILGELRGTKFEDVNGNGVRDAGEGPLEGVTIYLDLDDDGVLNSGSVIEPDDFEPGTILNEIDEKVTFSLLSQIGSQLPFPITAPNDAFGFAPTGSQVFGHSGVPFFNSFRRLRMDFTDSVDRVSIDFAGGNLFRTEMGRLEIYNASGVLLDTYMTQPLAGGEVETMVLSRDTAEIAFAIAFTEPGFGNFGRLDNLNFGFAEPTAVTDVNGEYQFGNLTPGDYVVREVVPEGFIQTSPVATPARLFATSVTASPDQIVELDPVTGAIIHQFDAPADVNTGGHGLAFDGTTVFFADLITDTIYEVDPDTGALLDSTALPPGVYDGIAAQNGLVYIAQFATDDILVFDPDTNSIVNTLDINASNPGINLIGGLGEIGGPDELIATTTTDEVVFIDPVTGLVTSSFSHALGSTFDSAVAGSGQEIFLGFSN
ncbi:MAG: hypothetical protein MI861_21350, partial [Pirellulales bacterium]|nr:hypothetical protein [Pirellulales bacterium]